MVQRNILLRVLRGEGGDRAERGCCCRGQGPQKLFIFCCNNNQQSLTLAQTANPRYLHAMFHSLPYDPRPLTATEARLEAIYAAAKLGLKGDSLALAAGMTPTEYRRLCQMDPIAEYAEQKGRADGERVMATTLYAAAEAGDARAATEMLRYAHGWVAKQAVEVSIEQKISITAALEQAQQRGIDLVATELHADASI
jgi:hypothetical protein